MSFETLQLFQTHSVLHAAVVIIGAINAGGFLKIKVKPTVIILQTGEVGLLHLAFI